MTIDELLNKSKPAGTQTTAIKSTTSSKGGSALDRLVKASAPKEQVVNKTSPSTSMPPAKEEPIAPITQKVSPVTGKVETLSQGKASTLPYDTTFKKVIRAITPHFLEKELGIAPEQVQSKPLSKADTVKLVGNAQTRYQMQKNPESITAGEYLRRGLSFGNELDPTVAFSDTEDISIRDLPEPTTRSQKTAQLIGNLLTMRAAQPFIGAALNKIPGVSALAEKAILKPFSVGYPLAIAKAGVEGGLFGLITKNDKTIARNALESAGTFAAFEALAYPIIAFFRPVLKEVGSGKFVPDNMKGMIDEVGSNEPVQRTLWFRNPKNDKQLLRIDFNGRASVVQRGSKGIPATAKDAPILTDANITAFESQPSMFEKLKGYVAGKLKPGESFKLDGTTINIKPGEAESPIDELIFRSKPAETPANVARETPKTEVKLGSETPSYSEAGKLIEQEGGFAGAKSLPAKNRYAADELASSLGMSAKYLYEMAMQKNVALDPFLKALDKETDTQARIDVQNKMMTKLSGEAIPKSSEEALSRYYDAKLANDVKEGKAVSIGADDMKDHFNNDYNDENHPTYSKASYQTYEKLLNELPGKKVALTGGGAGVGKTEIIVDRLKDGGDVNLIYDSNLSSIEGAKNAIKAARDAGKEVEIYGIIADLNEARSRTIVRENQKGRGISDKTFANGHVGFPETVGALIEEGIIKPEEVYLLDLRKVNTLDEAAAMIVNKKFADDPLALVKNLGYNRESVTKDYARTNYDKTGKRLSSDKKPSKGDVRNGQASKDAKRQGNNGGSEKGKVTKKLVKFPTIHRGGEIKIIEGTPIKIWDGVKTFIYKGEGNSWVVSEAKTGKFLAESKTQEGAIAKAKSNIKEVGKEEFLRMIEANKLPSEKKKESTPQRGVVGASIGRFREEGDIRLGNFDQIKPIEFPELLDLAKELSGSEVFIKKYKLANGKFYGKDGRIGLNPDLFKAGNLQQLQKTMAHEIGHLIDYLPEGTLSRGNTLGRLAVLRDFRKDFFAKAGVARTNKEVTDQLWKLSKYWKPIDEATASPNFLAYRKSAPEIYADFISVLFNNPQLAGELAPTAYNIFFEQLDAKPKVKEVYFELQDSLRNGEEVLKARRDKVRNMFTTAEQRARDRQAQIKLEQEMKQKSAWFRFKFQFVSRIESFRDLVKQAEKEGKIVTDDDNPVYYLEESNYLGGKIKSIVDEKFNTIYQELQKNGMSWDDLGEIMFYERILKGDRQEVANPEGIQIDFIRDLYDGLNEGVQADATTGTKGSQSLKAQLGDDNFAKLQSLAQEYRTAVKDLYREAYKEGLFKKETMDMIEANDYYVPFKPIKYAGTRTNYRIKNKKGTLHQIENPANTGIEKTIDLIKAIERNKVNTKAIEFLQKNFPKELQEAQYAFNGKARIALEPKDKDLKLVSYMKDGKQQSFYVDQYIGEALQKSPVAQSNMIMSGLRFLNSGLFRPLFITFNLGFQSFNFIRDAIRFWKNVPDMTLIKTLKLYSKSYTASKVRAFGISENPTPKEQKAYDLVNKLERQKILSITYNDISKGGNIEDSQIERIMQGVGVHEAKPSKLGTLASKVGVTRNTPIIKQAFQIMEFIEKTGNLIETLPKIAGYYAVEGKFPAKEMGSFIRRKIGSPDFLDGGKFKPVINEVFLFSNAIFQGIRSDFEVATEPKTRSGYWWKTMQATILPKLLMFLASLGVFGAYIKKMFDKVSEYDKTNYTVVPLGIDQNDKAIYFRMPQDETGRLIGGIFWKLAGVTQDPKKLAELGTYTDFISYAGGQAPSVSPSITALYATQTFLAGENPYDFFRNRPVLTTEQMQAGGKYKTKPFLAYMFDNLGGGVFTKLYSNDTVPKNPSLGEKAVGLPVVSNIAGRFIKFSNYGETEKLREITGEIKTTKARENIENRKVIFNAVDSAKGKPYGEAQAIKKQMILDLFGGKLPTTKEDRIKMRTFEKRFDTLRIRGTADAKVDALITAQSNDEKVALLKEYKSTMTDKEFTDLRNFIIKNKVVSSDAFQQFVREQK